jgi:hypothetical protein
LRNGIATTSVAKARRTRRSRESPLGRRRCHTGSGGRAGIRPRPTSPRALRGARRSPIGKPVARRATF